MTERRSPLSHQGDVLVEEISVRISRAAKIVEAHAARRGSAGRMIETDETERDGWAKWLWCRILADYVERAAVHERRLFDGCHLPHRPRAGLQHVRKDGDSLKPEELAARARIPRLD